MQRRLAVVLSLGLSGLSGALGLGCGPDVDPNLCAERQQIRICADGPTLRGIDVSKYQATVDWAQVKGAGMSFAFARVSDGLANPDAYFAANWPGMRDAGLVRGAYQFFRASKDPIAQADLLLDAIAAQGGLLAEDLPPVIDFELLDGVSSAAAVTAAQAWLDHVELRLARRPIIYTGNNLASTTMAHFSAYPLWVPNYMATCPLVPDGWTRWTFWQDSGMGSVAGVTGDVDTNYFNGDAAALAAFVGATGPTPPGSGDMGSAPPDLAHDPCNP